MSLAIPVLAYLFSYLIPTHSTLAHAHAQIVGLLTMTIWSAQSKVQQFLVEKQSQLQPLYL